MHRLEFRAMGSQMLALIDSEGCSCALALSQAPRWFERWEQQLSRFRPDSELMRLNAAGQLKHAGAALWEVLALALEAAEHSDGLVTPLVLDAVEAAGYTVSFDELRRTTPEVTPVDVSSADEHIHGSRDNSAAKVCANALQQSSRAKATQVSLTDAALPTAPHPNGDVRPGQSASLAPDAPQLPGPTEAMRVSSTDAGLLAPLHSDGDVRPAHFAPAADRPWRGIRHDEETRSIILAPGLRLDLGGFAKGWAADRAAAALATTGPALVDAGGDIAVSGPMADGGPWAVAVADPREPEADLALLLLRHGGVCTSGRDYRRWLSGGAWQHHIVDPRTGRPAKTDLLSVTVVGPSASQAEVAAKAALILGSAAGLAWIEARPELAALFVRDDGRLVESQRLAAYRWKELP